MSRKRARSSSASGRESNDDENEDQVFSRDPVYYDEDGNCVIRVENVLFKTYRFLLERESEVLADMFRLPQGAMVVEGTTDDSPIVLAGDKAAQFRAFLRFSLASGMATQITTITIADMEDVAHLAHFSNKYLIASWRQWAIAALVHCCRVIDAGVPLPSAALASAMLIAREDPVLSSAISRAWKFRLENGIMDFSDALDAGEAAGNRDFLTDVYYLALTRKPMGGGAPSSTQFPHAHLRPAHVRRLLAGSYSLTMLWMYLSDNPPDYELPAVNRSPCGNHASCIEAWKTLWRTQMHSEWVDRFNPADVLGRLQHFEICLRGRLPGAPRRNYFNSDIPWENRPACFTSIMENNNPFHRLRTEIRDSLDTRFFGAEDFALATPLIAA
ncbi:hypothetical protein DFH06DRAFT_1246149 [Mycena polygramma]|nr:hypothetical protein DFH06DRAFT_1246149 [Mycena polygramma]